MKKRVPYNIIVAAKSGDEEAMSYILKFYEPLINMLCKETGTDENGMHYEKLNEEWKSDLETHMMLQIINNYDIARQPPEQHE